MMEEEYSLPYLISSSCESMVEEEAMWNADLYEMYRRVIFKNFESYLMKQENDNG